MKDEFLSIAWTGSTDRYLVTLPDRTVPVKDSSPYENSKKGKDEKVKGFRGRDIYMFTKPLNI